MGRYRKQFLGVVIALLLVIVLLEMLGPNTVLKKIIIENRVQKYLIHNYKSQMTINKIIYRAHKGGHKVEVIDEKRQNIFIVWVIPDTADEVWDTYVINLWSTQLKGYLEHKIQLNGIEAEIQVKISEGNELPLTWCLEIWDKYKGMDIPYWQQAEELLDERAICNVKYKVLGMIDGSKRELEQYIYEIISVTLSTKLRINKIEVEYTDDKGEKETFKVEY